MTVPGPWIQPDDVTLDVGYQHLRGTQRGGIGGDLGLHSPANLSDRRILTDAILGLGNSYTSPLDGPWADGYGDLNASVAHGPRVEVLSANEGDVINYLAFSMMVPMAFYWVRPADLPAPPVYPDPPPNYVGVEAETPAGTPLEATFAATVEAQVDGNVDDGVQTSTAYALLADPGDYTGSTGYDFLPVGPTGNTGNPWWAPATLAAMTVLGSATASTATGNAASVFTLALDLSEPSVVVAVATSAQLAPPAPGPLHGFLQSAGLRSPYGVVDPDGGTWLGDMSGPHVIYTYRPPRIRWIYAEAPPQRQFPRDDGLAASTRRSWPPRSSRQRGARRGPSGTYL